MSETKKGGRKPSRRQLRYGKLVRGWGWRTTPDLLKRADDFIKVHNLTQTELIEKAIEKYINPA